MKNYLVTGAAGFIGGAVAKKLISQGYKVVTIDNLSTGFREEIPNGVYFIEGNCQDITVINKLNDFKFDAILHIAGQSSGEISFDDPVYDLQTNTQSTLLLLKYALSTGCRKFLYASTMSVYGDQPDKPVSENAQENPKSFYGVGKIASEHYMRIYSQYGIDSVALRLFNVYGPGQNLENLRQGMVSIFLAQAVNQKHIHVKGSKDRYRDFIYIDDVVNAFLSFINEGYTNNAFRFYNICTGVRTTIEELIELMKDRLPFEFSVKYSGSTSGDQFGITGDLSKIKNEIGWEAKYPLKEGMKNFTEWALKNRKKHNANTKL